MRSRWPVGVVHSKTPGSTWVRWKPPSVLMAWSRGQSGPRLSWRVVPPWRWYSTVWSRSQDSARVQHPGGVLRPRPHGGVPPPRRHHTPRQPRTALPPRPCHQDRRRLPSDPGRARRLRVDHAHWPPLPHRTRHGPALRSAAPWHRAPRRRATALLGGAGGGSPEHSDDEHPGPRDLTEEPGRGFHLSLLGGPVHPDQAEVHPIAERPLEVVERRPV